MDIFICTQSPVAWLKDLLVHPCRVGGPHKALLPLILFLLFNGLLRLVGFGMLGVLLGERGILMLLSEGRLVRLREEGGGRRLWGQRGRIGVLLVLVVLLVVVLLLPLLLVVLLMLLPLLLLLLRGDGGSRLRVC